VIILDTTVLAHAVGVAHPLREPCRQLLAAHADGWVEATTTVEVIQEFAHIRARRQPRPDAVRVARQYAAAVALTRQADALVSADRAFAAVAGLTWVDPLTPAMLRLIGD
jgi:uncharacterized protein